MNLKDILEIILVTYNRKKYLQHTLEQLFAENSPIKNCDITILDNASTDGTGELIQNYQIKFPNIKHIKRPRNIGGNGNIANAFSLVTKKYYWIICDDDEFDFSAWQEVENALTKEDYDIIMVNPSNVVGGEFSLPRIINACSFLPAVIGKSENITEAVLYDTFDNISNWFPHLAPVCSVVNKKGKIYLTTQDIVRSVSNEIRAGVPTYKRIKDLSERAKYRFFQVCYLNSLYLIKDKKLRAEIVDDYFKMPDVKKYFIFCIEDVVKSPYNYLAPLTVMTFWQKIKFLSLIIFIHILYLFGFRSYLWYQYDKVPKWQMKLIKVYKCFFKKK